MSKLLFSGHESFHCRSLWLKKGYDFISYDKNFSEPSAVVDLGIGKNMVSSINYWMKSFGMLNQEGSLSQLAEFIFNNKGVDPYLEDTASLWLLHYHIVSENFSSIYSLVFNEFRKKRIEFNKTQLMQFVKRKCESNNTNFNEKTIQRDISVFLRNYVRAKKSTKNIEELFSGLFVDLDLILQLKKFDEEDSSWYKIENKDRKDLPAEIVLYSILSNAEYENSITFDELTHGYNSVGNIFALSQKGLLEKINTLTKSFKFLTLSDDAGIRVLQFKRKPDKWEVLKKYYEK